MTVGFIASWSGIAAANSVTSAPSQSCNSAAEFAGFSAEVKLSDDQSRTAEALSATYDKIAGVRGILFDSAGAPTLVVSPDSERSALPNGVGVLTSCVTDQSLAETIRVVTATKLIDEQFISVGYNPYTDKIAVISSLPVDEINRDLPNPDDVAVSSGSAARTGRNDDGPPHYSGARLVFPGGQCSSGFYATSGYGPFMLTAGHCGNLYDAVSNGTGSSSFGSVAARSFPNPDLMIINGSTYAGRVYNAANTTSNTGVSGSGDPSLGVSYCNFGSFILLACSNYNILSTQYCDTGGCTNNLAYTERACAWGPVVQSGDSGGAVGANLSSGKVGARGIVIAGGSFTDAKGCHYVRWDHKWSTIAATYGLTIVNG
jgi:hypothetical protein